MNEKERAIYAFNFKHSISLKKKKKPKGKFSKWIPHPKRRLLVTLGQ